VDYDPLAPSRGIGRAILASLLLWLLICGTLALVFVV
jgi:hypothetical protein